EVLAGADVLAERADDDAANRHVRARGVTAERNVPAGGEAEKVFSGVAAGADAHGEAAAVEVGAVEVGDRGDAGAVQRYRLRARGVGELLAIQAGDVGPVAQRDGERAAGAVDAVIGADAKGLRRSGVDRRGVDQRVERVVHRGSRA